MLTPSNKPRVAIDGLVFTGNGESVTISNLPLNGYVFTIAMWVYLQAEFSAVSQLLLRGTGSQFEVSLLPSLNQINLNNGLFVNDFGSFGKKFILI